MKTFLDFQFSWERDWERGSGSYLLGLKLGGERDHWEGFSHGETLFSVNKERIGLDFQVVLQSCLISE